MSICSIDDKKKSQLIVIWDLGRRCTYECSYCPPHRRNSWSPLADLSELQRTADNLENYHQIYNQYRSTPFSLNTSFTGGEPTVNPAFFDFLIYLENTYPHWKRTLTSNGFYTERKLRIVMENTAFTTISYHCEGTAQQKQIIRRNMEIMHQEKYGFKVNVMFHENDEYFKECIELCEWFDLVGIKYTPRVIGDQGDIKEGIKDKTVHTYSEWQMLWFKNYWSLKTQSAVINQVDKKLIGQTMGRPCCGGRTLDLQSTDGAWEQSKFIVNNNFKGWNCMINWYFLYIHQEIDQIWHHQTCQVNLDGEIGPICKASEFDKYNTVLKQTMSSGNIPYITCPKTHCGCGWCVPKASQQESAIDIFNRHTKDIQPIISPVKENVSMRGTLKSVVISTDRKNNVETTYEKTQILKN